MKGWVLPGHKYTGPFNELESQLKYDPQTGEILEIYDQPTAETDAVAMQQTLIIQFARTTEKIKTEQLEK